MSCAARRVTPKARCCCGVEFSGRCCRDLSHWRFSQAYSISASRLGMVEADLRALVFTSLVLINMGLILVNRSFESSLARALLQPNRALWILLGGVLSLLGVAVYWPPAQSLFHFGKLHWNDLAVCLAVGAISLVGLEAMKSRIFRTPLVDSKVVVRT